MRRPEGETLSEAQRFDWLRLWRSENVGPRSFQGLIKRFGTAKRALEALPGLERRPRVASSLRAPGSPLLIAKQTGLRILRRGRMTAAY